MSVRFYNAVSKQWEIHEGAITDLDFAPVEFRPTFEIVDTYNKAGRSIRLLKEDVPYTKITPKMQRAIDAFNGSTFSPPENAHKYFGMSKDHFKSITKLFSLYRSKTPRVDTKPPFHVEKLDLSAISKIRTTEYECFSDPTPITVTPLTLRNRVKMKLQGLYKSFKQLFIPKPLTPRERALKALQGNK